MFFGKRLLGDSASKILLYNHSFEVGGIIAEITVMPLNLSLKSIAWLYSMYSILPKSLIVLVLLSLIIIIGFPNPYAKSCSNITLGLSPDMFMIAILQICIC